MQNYGTKITYRRKVPENLSQVYFKKIYRPIIMIPRLLMQGYGPKMIVPRSWDDNYYVPKFIVLSYMVKIFRPKNLIIIHTDCKRSSEAFYSQK